MMQLIAGQLINGIIVGSLYGIIALAVSLTSGITGVVNFALGAFMLVGAYLTWHLNETYSVAFPFAVILVMGAVALIGLVADVLLFRHTRNNLINGLIVSIGLVSVIVALVHMTWTSTPQNMQPFVAGVFTVGGVICQAPRSTGLPILAMSRASEVETRARSSVASSRSFWVRSAT